MKRYRRRRNLKSEAQRKREAKESAARTLEKTKRKLGIGRAQALKGVTPSPLVTKGWERKPRPAPTSDRIPGFRPVEGPHVLSSSLAAYGSGTGARRARAMCLAFNPPSRRPVSLLSAHIALIVPLHACRVAALLSERLRLRVSFFHAHLG